MKPKYWVLLVACLLVLVLDQYTKYEVQQKLPLHHRVEVIRGFFNLTHVRNTGGAFGIFGGKRGGVGTLFFMAVSFIAIGSLLFFVWKAKEDEKNLVLSFSLVLAGAIGNLFIASGTGKWSISSSFISPPSTGLPSILRTPRSASESD